MAYDLKQALKSSGHKIQFKTIHSAKGLEAKVVFILGLHSNKGGFPDPWLQDKIYQVIKPTDYDYLLEEERRLFYVALTRAEDYLYLISQKGAVSEFIVDIPIEFIYQDQPEKYLTINSVVLCPSCESKLEDHYRFCPECGGNIEEKGKNTDSKKIENNKTGYCIRTGKKIPFNPKKPMSYSAYQSWVQYENYNFPEKYCHKTGELSNKKTSMANPILKK